MGVIVDLLDGLFFKSTFTTYGRYTIQNKSDSECISNVGLYWTNIPSKYKTHCIIDSLLDIESLRYSFFNTVELSVVSEIIDFCALGASISTIFLFRQVLIVISVPFIILSSIFDFFIAIISIGFINIVFFLELFFEPYEVNIDHLGKYTR